MNAYFDLVTRADEHGTFISLAEDPIDAVVTD